MGNNHTTESRPKVSLQLWQNYFIVRRRQGKFLIFGFPIKQTGNAALNATYVGIFKPLSVTHSIIVCIQSEDKKCQDNSGLVSINYAITGNV